MPVTKPQKPAPAEAPRQWRSRIVGEGEEDAGQLLANPANWRIHSGQQQKALGAVLDEVGWVQRVIVNRRTGHVVDGHLRVALAIRKGEKVPVVYIDVSEDEERLILATIDPLSAMAGTDEDLLAALRGAMLPEHVDIAELCRAAPETLSGPVEAEDDAPPVPSTPVSRLGDLWLCGPHRVLCGDSTSVDAVARVCGAASGLPVPFLMVTDPPYGVEYDPEWRLQAGISKPWQTRAEGLVSNDDRDDWSAAWQLFPGDVAYVWHGGGHAATVAISLLESKLLIRSQIIWAKPSLVIGRGAYHWQHEPCWYAVRKGKSAHWNGDRTQSTLWQIPNMHRTQGDVDDGKTVHSTQKPVECMRRPIVNHTSSGDAVYDPFLGSGTTMIAAERENRICYGLELAPEYVDVIVRRWQTFTGKQATLDGDGRTFDEIAAERAHVEAAA
jgi:DNA modification methylase